MKRITKASLREVAKAAASSRLTFFLKYNNFLTKKHHLAKGKLSEKPNPS
jgi:hypothetical protein